ncbi:MAG: hypothetical protein ACJAWW_000149 [Sulfurimonas sp.]|jgi:hypothetical protein
MFKLGISSIIVLMIFATNAFALVASDVDMSSAIKDISTVVASVVAFLAFLMGSKRVLRMLG